MTKLNWERAGHYEPDPGSVVEVTNSGLPPDDVPYVPKRERARRYAKERKALLERSEQKRLRAVAVKKARLRAGPGAKPVEKPE